MNKLKSDDVVSFDLQGKFIMPGFVDSHVHPGLVSTLAIDKEEQASESLPQDSKEALFAYLKQYAQDNWYQPFIFLGEWDVDSFLPNGPTKEVLDEIFPWQAVILADNSGHSFWVNSAALWFMDIDKDTPDLSPGISHFVRDEDGEPTGWVKEFAMFPYMGDLLIPSQKDLKHNLTGFLAFLSGKGVTTLWDAGNFDWHDDIYPVVADLDKAGKLPLRYEGSYHIWHPNQLSNAIVELKALRTKYSGERLKFNTIKIHFDGVGEIQTAGMLEPYIGTENNRGGTLFNKTDLANFILKLNQENIHLHLHSVGDRSTKEALSAIELAREKNMKPLVIRMTLSHLETVSPEDIAKFKTLDVHANFTPHWFSGTHFGNAGARNLGPERESRSQLANQFIAQGANVTLSSDVVSEVESYRANPFIGLQMSITRTEYNSAENGHLTLPVTEGLTLNDALAAYSKNGAIQLGMDKDVGSLSAGKKADFIILEQNLFDMKVVDIHKVEPMTVVVDGVVVAGKFTPSI